MTSPTSPVPMTALSVHLAAEAVEPTDERQLIGGRCSAATRHTPRRRSNAQNVGHQSWIGGRLKPASFEKTGMSPQDLDVVDFHDAFTVAEPLYDEALGLSQHGGAVKLLRSGATTLSGSAVVNPSGGLLAEGHPIGAPGAAQAVEIVCSLRGIAGRRHVGGARIGLSHATGSGLSGVDHRACTIHILERPPIGRRP